MKLVWEKASHVQVEIEIADLSVHPPRERDTWLMQEFVRLNYSSEDLRRLNCVQVHQEVLFLSNIMDANGRALDRKYLQQRPWEESWSNLSFPIKQPPPKDFKLWRMAIPQIRALGGRLHLGNYVRQGHKIWAWRYDLENSKLYHCKGNLVNIYEQSTFPGARTRANRYSRTRLEDLTRVSLRGEVHVQWREQGWGYTGSSPLPTCPHRSRTQRPFWMYFANGAVHGCGKRCALRGMMAGWQW